MTEDIVGRRYERECRMAEYIRLLCIEIDELRQANRDLYEMYALKSECANRTIDYLLELFSNERNRNAPRT